VITLGAHHGGRLKLFAAPSVSFAWKILISKVTICFARLNHFLVCLHPVPRTATPPLLPSGDSDTEDSDSERPSTPPTLFSLGTETKQLYREVMKYSSSPKVVDLSVLNAKRAEAKGGKVWLPRKKYPAQQVLDRKMEGERLSRRVHGLLERASALGASL
jgi:dynactin 1